MPSSNESGRDELKKSELMKENEQKKPKISPVMIPMTAPPLLK
jgi:hypothetical protein